MQDAAHKHVEQKARRQKILWLFAGLAVGGGSMFAYNYFTGQLPSVSLRINDSAYKYINPLLECDAGSSISQELHGFKSDISDQVNKIEASGQADFISVYFRDMNNGPWFGINESEPFSPASLLKVPIMMAYFKQSEADPALLNKKISFEKPINTYQEYFTSTGIELGHTYTVSELIKSMIVYSDNDAMDLLVVHAPDFGVDTNDVFKYLNVDLTSRQGLVTVRQYSTFFRILFNASYIDYDNSEKALSYLDQTVFTSGIRAGVPSTVGVSHKFGERWDLVGSSKRQLHDCGIVYYPGHPYLLCVMTRGNDFTQLSSAISTISGAVYADVDKQFK